MLQNRRGFFVLGKPPSLNKETPKRGLFEWLGKQFLIFTPLLE